LTDISGQFENLLVATELKDVIAVDSAPSVWLGVTTASDDWWPGSSALVTFLMLLVIPRKDRTKSSSFFLSFDSIFK